MQPSNQSKKYFPDNDFFDTNDEAMEGQRSFAEVVNNEEDDSPNHNIFTSGNMLLRNEESELEQGSLNDPDFKSGSHSDDDADNKDKIFAPYSHATPSR